jgi:hypothetical protein
MSIDYIKYLYYLICKSFMMKHILLAINLTYYQSDPYMHHVANECFVELNEYTTFSKENACSGKQHLFQRIIQK